jgi:GT2 family glycosyltransferase
VTAPLPEGFRIELDADTRRLDETWLFGGSPARLLRLSPAGRQAWDELEEGRASTRQARALGRRLTDAGMAHPRPPIAGTAPDVTVVIPVRDRTDGLERCLAACAGAHPVIVVDDESADAPAIAAVCARHDATLVRRDVNGGPGPARDTALARTGSELVAFLDSDCIPPPGWVAALARHFADPLVGAVAPRIVGATADSWAAPDSRDAPDAPDARDARDTLAGRYTRANSSLDLGDRPALVRPGSRVTYVPTAALLTRRSALATVARDGAVFDPRLRVGEDVDLIWRLSEAGWRIRYEPEVHVAHTEPATWPQVLRRRFRYGTSAAPLARRHPGAGGPLALYPWPAATVLGALSGRPLPALLGFLGSVRSVDRKLRTWQAPRRGVVAAMWRSSVQTWLGVGRYATQFASPVLVAIIVRGRCRSRLAAASLLLGPPVAAWRAGRAGRAGRADRADRSGQPSLSLPCFAAGQVADDIAYGLGVWAGCARERTLAPVRPAIARSPVRKEG